MNEHYTLTMAAVQSLLGVSDPSAKAHAALTLWHSTVTNAAAKLEPEIALLKDCKNDVKMKASVRSMRLGLRLAGIDPRGAYWLPQRNLDAIELFEDQINKVGKLVKELTNAIAPSKKVLEGLLAALETLLPEYNIKLQPATLLILEHLLIDLKEHINFKPHRDFRTDHSPTSSYWPSSFVASSSSSSTLPHP